MYQRIGNHIFKPPETKDYFVIGIETILVKLVLLSSWALTYDLGGHGAYAQA